MWPDRQSSGTPASASILLGQGGHHGKRFQLAAHRAFRLVGAFHENDPQPGYYRMRDGKGGAFVPVAIWHDGSGINALRGGGRSTPARCGRGVAASPSPTSPMSPSPNEASPGPTRCTPSAITAPPGPAAARALAADIADFGPRPATGWPRRAIATQALADKAANFAERFAALEKQAEEQRTLEKKPVLEAGRAIDARGSRSSPPPRGQDGAEAGDRPFLRAEKARLEAEAGRPDRRHGPAPPGGAWGCGR